MIMKRDGKKETASSVGPIICFLFIVLSSGISFAQPTTSDLGWPRIFEANGNKVVVYQPQLEDWEDYKNLRGKAALKNTDREYFGALSLKADTVTDFDSRIVLLRNLQIAGQTFPNVEDRLAGNGVAAHTISRPVGPPDIAATIAAYLEIKPPSGSVGVPLVEVLKE